MITIKKANLPSMEMLAGRIKRKKLNKNRLNHRSPSRRLETKIRFSLV